MKVVPVPGNPALEKKDSTNPPDWAKYEIKLREKSFPGLASADRRGETADSSAKWLYSIIGSSSVTGNKWQVDWVLYTHRAWGKNWPVGNAIFMLRFEDLSNGIMIRIALSNSNDFEIVDSSAL